MPVDVLTQGSERPSWFAGLLQRLHPPGVAAHSGHRARMVALVGLLLAAVTGAVYLETRPPPVDPVVHVRFFGRVILPDSTPTFPEAPPPGDPVVRGTYTMHTDVVGDSVQLLGIVGPGLRPLDASGDLATVGRDATVHASAAVACSQPGWWSATDDDYRMRVRRTDSHGRSVEYLAPFGATTKSWRTEVHQECVQRAARQLTVSTVEVDSVPGRPMTHVTFTVRNPMPYQIWIQPLTDDLSPGLPVQVMGPGGSVDLTLPWLVTDCGPRSGPWVDSYEAPAYLWVRLDTAPLGQSDSSPEGVDPHQAGVFLDPALTNAALDGIDQACAGIPALRTSVESVQPVAVTGPSHTWKLGVRVRVDADRLAFGIQQVTARPNARFGDDDFVELPPATRVRDGLARVTVGWSVYSCDQDDRSPPGMYVVAVVDQRRYPQWVTLNDRNLLAAVRGVCPSYPGTTGW